VCIELASALLCLTELTLLDVSVAAPHRGLSSQHVARLLTNLPASLRAATLPLLGAAPATDAACAAHLTCLTGLLDLNMGRLTGDAAPPSLPAVLHAVPQLVALTALRMCDSNAAACDRLPDDAAFAIAHCVRQLPLLTVLHVYEKEHYLLSEAMSDAPPALVQCLIGGGTAEGGEEEVPV
jgi:hypothetical protein